jgi:transcription regulator MmyB-like protein
VGVEVDVHFGEIFVEGAEPVERNLVVAGRNARGGAELGGDGRWREAVAGEHEGAAVEVRGMLEGQGGERADVVDRDQRHRNLRPHGQVDQQLAGAGADRAAVGGEVVHEEGGAQDGGGQAEFRDVGLDRLLRTVVADTGVLARALDGAVDEVLDACLPRGVHHGGAATDFGGDAVGGDVGAGHHGRHQEDAVGAVHRRSDRGRVVQVADDEIGARRADFRTWWAEYPVRDFQPTTIGIDHPTAGPIDLVLYQLRVVENPESLLVVQIPATSADRDRVAMLLSDSE